MITRDVLQDLAIALAVTAFALVVAVVDDPGGTTAAIALAVIGGASLVGRRRSPIVVLAVVVVSRLLMTLGAGGENALMPAAIVALYTVVRSGDRRVRLPIAIGAAVVMMLFVATIEDEPFHSELIAEAAQMGLPIAVAEAVRSRAERVRQMIDAEAAARVQSERLRIARDLHDVVAHGLTAIAVQSGVAARLIDRDKAQAKEALTIINATGKRSLDELRAMVGVLRSSDDAPLEPTPADPDDLSVVLDGGRAAGLDVTLEVDGAFPPGAVDASVVAVHRIVQEALTNVARHAGPVTVDVRLTHAPDRVTVKVTNPPGALARSEVPSTGVGVVGMTERAEALGGSLRAGPTVDGGYEVAATVPYYRRSP